jgi:hypothetical protein
VNLAKKYVSESHTISLFLVSISEEEWVRVDCGNGLAYHDQVRIGKIARGHD